MKNLKKSILPIAILAVFALTYFVPSRASEISSHLVKPDTMFFSGCWGSGDFNKSCSNGGATVMGCEPEQGSFCAGVRELPDLPE